MSTNGKGDLVVTVTHRFAADYLERMYAEAITFDGGYTGAFDEWVEELADGIIDHMRGAAYDAKTTEPSWSFADSS